MVSESRPRVSSIPLDEKSLLERQERVNRLLRDRKLLNFLKARYCYWRGNVWFIGWSRATRARDRKHPLPTEKARERGVKVCLPSRASWITALCDAYKVVCRGRNPDLFKGKRGEKEFDTRVGGRNGFWPGGPQFVRGHKRNAEHKTIPPLCLNILGDLQRIEPDQMPRAKDVIQVFTEEEVGPIRPFLPLAHDGEEVFPPNLPAKFEKQDQQQGYSLVSNDTLEILVAEALEKELAAIRNANSRPATASERARAEKGVAVEFEQTVRQVRLWTAEIQS